MKVEKDFAEFFALLNKHKARYCVVGSYAVAFHAKPRYTKDIDILIEASQKNAKKMVGALNEYGFQSLRLSEKDFSTKDKIIQLGYEPVRIDIMTSLEGCEFEEAWKNKVRGKYGTEDVFFMGIDDLIKTKKISRRHIDRHDLELLERAKRKK
jgi:predicted nucleotidyltransferase